MSDQTYETLMQDEDSKYYLKEAANEILLNSKELGDFIKQYKISKNLRSYQQVIDFIKHLKFEEYGELPKNEQTKKRNEIETKFEKEIQRIIEEEIIPAFLTGRENIEERDTIKELRKLGICSIQDLITRSKLLEVQRESQRLHIQYEDLPKVKRQNAIEYLERLGIAIDDQIKIRFSDVQRFNLALAQREFEILSIKSTMQELELCFGNKLIDENAEVLLYRAGTVDEIGMHGKDKHSMATGSDHIYVGSKIKTNYISLTESPVLLSKFLSEFNSKHTENVYPTIIDCKQIYAMLQKRYEELEVNADEYSYTFDGEEDVLKQVLEQKRESLTAEQKQKIEQRLEKIKELKKYELREDLPTQFFDSRKDYDMTNGYSRAIKNEILLVRKSKDKDGFPFLLSSMREDATASDIIGKAVSRNSDPAAEYLFRRAIPISAIKKIDRISLDLIETFCSKDNEKEYGTIAKEIITGINKGKINFSNSLKEIFEDKDALDKLQKEGNFSIEELYFIQEYYIKGVSMKAYMQETYDTNQEKEPSKDEIVETEYDNRFVCMRKLLKTKTFNKILIENLPNSKALLENATNPKSKFRIGLLYHQSKSTIGYKRDSEYTHKVKSNFGKRVPGISIFYDRKNGLLTKTILKKEIAEEIGSTSSQSKTAAERLKAIVGIKERIKRDRLQQKTTKGKTKGKAKETGKKRKERNSHDEM